MVRSLESPAATVVGDVVKENVLTGPAPAFTVSGGSEPLFAKSPVEKSIDSFAAVVHVDDPVVQNLAVAEAMTCSPGASSSPAP